jgi:glycosyltransferase involved in cell wall biosynthesis
MEQALPSSVRFTQFWRWTIMTMSLECAARTFLSKTVRFRDALVDYVVQLEAEGDDEKTLRWIRLAAEVAWVAHSGKMSDERLEAIAVRIGQRLELPGDRKGNRSHDQGTAAARRRVLHVATTVIGTGGHTRLLENWIKADNMSAHSLLLVDQGQEAIRTALTDRVITSGGSVVVFSRDMTLLERSRQLRHAAQSGYDYVILHHNPNDVTPLVAFATEDCPPIAVMNHADHIFWLGVSITDLVVEFREFGAELSRSRRGVRRNFVFPLPLDIRPSTRTRVQARAHLKIPETERMLLTIGSAPKYMPTVRQDFFKTLSEVLDRDPNACLYVIGVGESDIDRLGIRPHNRLKLLGIIPDPTEYQIAADLYLEGYPFGSYTALLETSALGVYPVLMHSPTAHNDVSREVTLHGLTKGAQKEQSYVTEVTRLLNAPEERVRCGQIVAQRIEDHHSAKASRGYLEQIYRQLATLHHKVEPLPDRISQTERHDLDLAGFQSSRMRIPIADWISNETLRGLTRSEFLKLFMISIAAGDTRLALRHAKAWMSMIKRRVLSAS